MEYPRGINLAIVVLLAATILSAGESQSQVILGEHSSEVNSVLFFPDGTSLISLSSEEVKIWDTVANNLILETDTPPVVQNSVVISPDGKMLVINRFLWDIENARIVSTLGEAYVLAAVFSSDGKTLKFTNSDMTVTTWDVEKRELISTVRLAGDADRFSPQEVVAISPDGKLVASGGRGTREGSEVKIWNTETGALFHTLQVPDQGGLSFHNRVGLLVFSSDGVLAYMTGSSGNIILWDVEEKEDIATLEGGGPVVAFSPDGKMIGSGGGDGSVSLWDVETKELLFTDKSHRYDVTALMFSPDGSMIASGGGTFDRTVILWDVAGVIQKKEEQKESVALLLGHATNRDISSVAFSPVENILATGSRDGSVRFWNTENPNAEPIVLTNSGFEVTSVAFSVDGKVLASGSEDNTFSLWDVASKERVANVFGDGRGEINSVSFSSDGKRLATGRNNNRIEIWSADIRTHSQIEGVTAPSLAVLGEYERGLDVDVVAFADHKILGAVYDDGNVKVWDVESKAVLETIDLPEYIYSIAFTPDGNTLVMGGGTGGVTLCDIESRQATVSREVAKMFIRSVAVSPDGSRLAIGGRRDRASPSGSSTIKLWDVATRDSIALPEGLPEGDVYSVAFSPNGQRLAMGLEDGVVVLCNISEDAPPLTGETTPPSPDFDGDGTVGFSDFLLFAAAFGRSQGDAGYDARFDLDGNGAIGFSDFLIFAGAFGKSTASS